MNNIYFSSVDFLTDVKYQIKEKYKNQIEKGKKIRKVNLDEFLYALGYDESEVEGNYLKAVERVKKIIKKEELKKEKKKQERAKTL